MKKEYIDNPCIDDFIDAINNEGGILCESAENNDTIQITRVYYTYPFKDNAVCMDTLKNGMVGNIHIPASNVRLYRKTYEDGDYVLQQSGDIIICAGTENKHYLFHAALSKDGKLIFPDSEYYMYGSVMSDDRLCTEEEKMKINGELMKEGKIFDPVSGKIEYSMFKYDPSLFAKFTKKYEKYLAAKGDSPIPKLDIQIITVNKKTGSVEIPSCLTPEEINHVIVRCADMLKAKAESIPMFP